LRKYGCRRGGGGSKEQLVLGSAQNGGNGASGLARLTLTISTPTVTMVGSSCYNTIIHKRYCNANVGGFKNFLHFFVLVIYLSS